MMSGFNRVALLALLIALLAAPAAAAPVSLGYLQYDVFIPDDPDVLGTVTFTIGNLTSFGFSGYPVLDELLLQNARLELTAEGAAPETLDLGTLGVGELVVPPEFPVITTFTSVRLLASLSATEFLIDDGLGGSTPFAASSDQIVATLFFGGEALVPGSVVDIQVMPASVSVAEPSSLLLFGIGAGLALRAGHRRRLRD